MSEAFHQSILVEEIVELAEKTASRTILDVTLGDGGHTLAFHAAFPEAALIGSDRDPEMQKRARQRFLSVGVPISDVPRPGAVSIVSSRMSAVSDAIQEIGSLAPDFILADLGVSFHHFTGAGRGFSYTDRDLDMRLDPDLPESAADLVNELPERELANLFYKYGEERRSRPIARRIVQSRPVTSAEALADLVRSVVHGTGHGIHPATRVFQALRIAVNHELEEIDKALVSLPGLLAPGGILAVMSFHSLEDRPVKLAFRELAKSGSFEILTKKPIVPGEEEIRRNRASRSAKLRAIRKRPENEKE